MIRSVLGFKKLDPRAIIPTRANPTDSGLDLSCIEGFILAPGERRLIPTGLSVLLPTGFEGQVRPRSGNALKKGVTVLNAPGTVDESYTGPLGVLLVNLSGENQTFQPGDRIAQLVLGPVLTCPVEEIQELPETDRGGGGWGSSGS